MPVTADQLRAARALLRLQQSDVAHRAGLSVATVRRLEDGAGSLASGSATVEGVRLVLEEAGVEFIHGGVRRRPAERDDTAALFDDLRAISLKSARRLAGADLLTEADLYDEGGLPA